MGSFVRQVVVRLFPGYVSYWLRIFYLDVLEGGMVLALDSVDGRRVGDAVARGLFCPFPLLGPVPAQTVERV